MLRKEVDSVGWTLFISVFIITYCFLLFSFALLFRFLLNL